jgi:hypothetical protein
MGSVFFSSFYLKLIYATHTCRRDLKDTKTMTTITITITTTMACPCNAANAADVGSPNAGSDPVLPDDDTDDEQQ